MRRSSSSSDDSTGSSAPDSPREEETMQIFVQQPSGTVIALSLPTTTTASTLHSLLALRHNLPPPSSSSSSSSLRLLRAGRPVPPSALPLPAAGITPQTTLQLALPIRGGTAGRKPTCAHTVSKVDAATGQSSSSKCTAQAQRIVGDCGFCGGSFCSKHRLLESHNCPGLEDCKRESHERNRERLERERTVVVRGV